jgi:hypothetical protein
MYAACVEGWLSDLSESVFEELSKRSSSALVHRDGFHMIDVDITEAFTRFISDGPSVHRKIFDLLPSLGNEMANGMCKPNSKLISTIYEGGWRIGLTEKMVATCHLTVAHDGRFGATPTFSLIKNIDCKPLNYRLHSFQEPFEKIKCLSAIDSSFGSLLPGDSIAINGFDEVVAWETSDVLVLSILTVPLGAYDVIFDMEGGQRIGSIATEVSASSLVTSLRVFGAANWPNALDLAQAARESALPELRWAALNYFWETDAPNLSSELDRFLSDEFPEIAALAKVCMENLASDLS